MKENLVKGLTEEQLSKASECKNTDALKASAKSEGIKLHDDDLAQASGGGIFSEHTVKEYNAAGVEVIGEGVFWNSGYKFRDKEISTEEAGAIVYYYQKHNKQPGSVKEAVDFFVNDVME